MSYCVNCGVELDVTMTSCPLCGTPVYNPKAKPDPDALPPFPADTGQVDEVKRKDYAILVSVAVAVASVTCALLNLLLIRGQPWSLLVVGACVVVWVALVPPMLMKRRGGYLWVLAEAAAIGVFLYLLTFQVGGSGWFYNLALPITGLAAAGMELFLLLCQRVSKAFLSAAAYLFAEAGAFCVALELLLRHYWGRPLGLGWSAVVLANCLVMVGVLLAVRFIGRLRSAVRRRLHF